jgi:hypothetical protein
VRGLHDASRPLEVVFPAAGLLVAGAGAEHTGSFFMRVYETVSLHLHERAANSFLRAQAVVDTVTAGKMAAVAASAAALAGGGVAVEGVLSEAPGTPQALVRRADNGLATTFVKQPARKAKTHTHAKARSHARPSTQRRHQTTTRPTVNPTSTTPASASPRAASTPRATVASTGSAHAAGTPASSEFGFEGP